jgi:hypothetical protein
VAAWTGSWWDAASRNVLGRVFFQFQLLRPVSVEGNGDCLGGASGLVELNNVKQWEVVHEREFPFENIKVAWSKSVRCIVGCKSGASDC